MNHPKMHYFEFDEHEYYALIAVEHTGDLMFSPTKAAMDLYEESIFSGEEPEYEDGLTEPNLRTKEYAFMKFILAAEPDVPVGALVDEFEKATTEILLLDGSLI